MAAISMPLPAEEAVGEPLTHATEEIVFDTLVALTDSEDRAKAVIEAMGSIEADYENQRGVLPKSEYQELDNAVLGQLCARSTPTNSSGSPATCSAVFTNTS